jgi:hypothetical protein
LLVLCCLQIKGHDVWVAVADPTGEELQQGGVHIGSLEKSERVLGLEEARQANKGKREDL